MAATNAAAAASDAQGRTWATTSDANIRTRGTISDAQGRTWATATDAQGKTYYYIPGTEQSSYEPPLPRGWASATAADGRVYYYNASNGETSYERPPPSAAHTPIDARALLVRFDENRDGLLTMTELRRLLMGLELDVEERNRAQACWCIKRSPSL